MIPQIIEQIKTHHRFLITAHVRLDGDALGSELALCQILSRMGKRAVVYNQDSGRRAIIFSCRGRLIFFMT